MSCAICWIGTNFHLGNALGRAIIVAAALGMPYTEMNIEDNHKEQCNSGCNPSSLITSIKQPAGKLRGAFAS